MQDEGITLGTMASVASASSDDALKLDGSGYPAGLSGAAIPDLVRVVTVCDISGALIARRPDRAPVPASGPAP